MKFAVTMPSGMKVTIEIPPRHWDEGATAAHADARNMLGELAVSALGGGESLTVTREE